MTTDRRIFIQGWHARNCGEPVESCPYYESTERLLWTRGWSSCQNEHDQVIDLMNEVRT